MGSLDLTFPGEGTQIGREAIVTAAGASLPDLLEAFANVRVKSYDGKSSGGQLAMRGFGENSGLRVLVEVDGQRLNPPDMGGIDWEQVPLQDIETVEVLRGGQNVLYGDHALAGVIRITTRRGGEPQSRLRLTGGADGYGEFIADHSGGNGNKFWDAGLRIQADNGYRQNAESSSETASGTVGLRMGKAKADSLAVSATLTDSYRQFPGPLLLEEYRREPRLSRNDGGEWNESTTGLLSALWRGHHPWGSSRLNASLHVRESEANLGEADTVNPENLTVSANEQRSLTLSPRLRWGGEAHFLLGGVDVVRDTLDLRRFLGASRQFTRSRADLERLSGGVYFFGQYEFQRDFFLSGGLRGEYVDGEYRNSDYKENQLRPFTETNRGTIPNPNYKEPPDRNEALSFDENVTHEGLAAELSLLWRAHEAWSLWTGYDRVYRTPVLDEIASYQGFSLAVPVNTELEAETGHQVEVGLKGRLGKATLSMTAFWLRLNGEILFDAAARLNRNLADTRRRGLELAWEWKAASWGAATRWSLVEAEFTGGPLTGKDVPLVPSAHASSSFWWRVREGWRIGLQHTWSTQSRQGSDFANNLRKLDGWHRFDFSLRAKLNRMRAFLRVDNFLNRNYAPLAFRGAYYPAPGRQWRAGVEISF